MKIGKTQDGRLAAAGMRILLSRMYGQSPLKFMDLLAISVCGLLPSKAIAEGYKENC